MGVPQKIMRAHCAVIRPDHFKFASYGPEIAHAASVGRRFARLSSRKPAYARNKHVLW